MAKGYSFAALVDVLYPFYKTSIAGDIDLNSFNSNDHVGMYVQGSNASAASGSNYPEPSAGCLEVLPNANGVIQRYTAYTGDNNTYVRSSFGGTWSAWKSYLTNGTIYNTVYPIGICVQFDANVNPNTAFPGTTWAQIVDGRQVRAAENAAAIGTTGGSDTVALQETNLAAHVHSVPVHSHTIATHSHTISQHQHTVSDHTHPISHGHTAWTDNQGGGHQHYIANGATQTGTGDAITLNGGNYLCGAFGPSGFGFTEYALKGNGNGADRGLTNFNGGLHGHNIGVSQLDANSGAADRVLYASLDGPTATGVGGPSATGSTAASNTGSVGGATPVAVAGAWHKYAIWKRTA